MWHARNAGVLALLLFSIGLVQSTVYFPPSCAHRCGHGDFIPPLPLEDGPVHSADNRAYAWAIITLIQTKLNFDSLSPPSVGRIMGIVGSCLYEAAALNEDDYGSTLDHAFKFHETGDDELIRHTLDGAGYWVVRRMFGNSDTFSRVSEQYTAMSGEELESLVYEMQAFTKLSPYELRHRVHHHPIDRTVAVATGAAVCERVIEQYVADGFTATGDLGHREDPTHYQLVNLPQRLAGITDCDKEMIDMNHWQPLCIPHSENDFGTSNCSPQKFLYPWAGRYTPFAIEHGDETTGLGTVDDPPRFGTYEFTEQWEEVLDYSANLDDTGKVIAEYWADGPDTTMPAGHLWKIGADAARSRRLSESETARLLFIVGNAVYDAGIASWRTKTSYDLVRPLQMIQCGAHGEVRMAWKGPYQGVGYSNISEWRPYQASDFVTPPFAAYTSGHSTFSAAASEALRLFFGGDDTYVGPSCDVILEGESLFEPLSYEFPGLSDHPNTGPDTTGYVPADDIVLCWETFTEASDQSGVSRLYGGIHIRADDDSGQQLGREVGRAVFEKASKLYSPTYYYD